MIFNILFSSGIELKIISFTRNSALILGKTLYTIFPILIDRGKKMFYKNKKGFVLLVLTLFLFGSILVPSFSGKIENSLVNIEDKTESKNC